MKQMLSYVILAIGVLAGLAYAGILAFERALYFNSQLAFFGTPYTYVINRALLIDAEARSNVPNHFGLGQMRTEPLNFCTVADIEDVKTRWQGVHSLPCIMTDPETESRCDRTSNPHCTRLMLAPAVMASPEHGAAVMKAIEQPCDFLLTKQKIEEIREGLIRSKNEFLPRTMKQSSFRANQVAYLQDLSNAYEDFGCDQAALPNRIVYLRIGSEERVLTFMEAK